VARRLPSRPVEHASRLDQGIGLALEGFDDDGTALLVFTPTALALVYGDPPFVHGGALATCVDTAGWYAVHHRRPATWVVADLRTDFLRLAGPGTYRVRATPLRVGRTLATVDVMLTPIDDPARVLMSGRATLVCVG
jgi:uncharacterized protein (TIGR00369 family)